MDKIRRSRRIAWILLGITLFLWVLAILYFLRISSLFLRLTKDFGSALTLGAMVTFPLIAIFIGTRMLREKQSVFPARSMVVTGVFLVTAFSVVIGIPMIIRVLEPKTPINPSLPREPEPQMGLPVFPGAEGFGTSTIAGRGGKVIEVTSLADHGPGTFREALEDPEPRTIIFRVSGMIELKESLYINHPYVTVAGQTAPGGGICIKNAGITITTHDVFIQHIRVRPGNEGEIKPEDNDAISILGQHGNVDGAYNVVIDHVSVSWGEDETISTWYGAHDITISWSIISEALNRSRHQKETHSAGLLVGNSSYNVSIHHNLLAHNDFRNPLIIDGGTHDIVNNIIYDWGVLAAEIVDEHSNSFLNFTGNYFIPGPSTQQELYEMIISTEEGIPLIFVSDNLGPHRPDPEMVDWAIVGQGYGSEPASEIYRSLAIFPVPVVTVSSAKDAYVLVLENAGATLPRRDSVDQRVVNDVLNRSGKIIDSPEQVGGYPVLDTGSPPLDSDHDGMPDEWELQWSLDPHDPSDGNEDLGGDGYTNVEEYLHSLSL